MELLVIVILFTVTAAQQSQLDGPGNTMSFVGSSVALKCSSPSRNCSGIDWQKYMTDGSPITVFKGPTTILNTNVTDRNRYSVDNSSGCDLFIRNVQLTDAGRFICSAIIKDLIVYDYIMSSSQTTKTAYLIIIEGHPKCTTDAFKDFTVEGDRRLLTCEVTYAGTDGTSLIWKGVDDAPAAVKNGNTLSRSYSVVASAPEVPSFNCVTSFAFETQENGELIKGLATNIIPNAMCATPVINVLYTVRNVSLSPSLSYNYLAGTNITCMAMGYPSPTYKWQEMDNCGTWEDIHNHHDSQFTMTHISSKRFRCVAMNVVRGISYNATSCAIQFINTEFNDDLSSTGPKCTCIVSKDRLGIGIGIGALATILLATVVVAILYGLRCVEFHPRPVNRPMSPAENMDQQKRTSSLQLSSMDQSIPRTGARLVGEQEASYASLEDDRDIVKYQSLEKREKAKPKKK